MQLKCDYCDGYLTELDENCPSCGAVNPGYKRQGDKVPKTIEELQQWYTEHNLPAPEVTRFFIGVDYKQPKAFGIYRDGDRVIVYKNKDTGERAIRYDGADEAYAVNEIYLKLKERVAEEKAKNATGRRGMTVKSNKKESLKDKLFFWAIILVIVVPVTMCAVKEPSQGYYNYNGSQYYYLDKNWYVYQYGRWTDTTVEDTLYDNYSDYYESSYYDSSYNTSNFEDTSYYSDWENSSWDSDSSWDSGDSWDSDGGDWGSDW